jgi:hypothetical protein
MFDSTSVSVAFRLESSTALMPEVRKLVDSGTDWDRFAGFRLAARIATEDAAALLADAIDRGSKSERLMALGQTRVLFLEVRKTDTPAIVAESLSQLATDLGRQLAEEVDQDLTLYQIRALRTLAEAGSPRIAAAQRAALVAMCDAIGARLARQSGGTFRGDDEQQVEMFAYLESADAIRAIAAVSVGATQLDEASLKSMGGLCGDLLAFVSRNYADLPKDSSSRRHFERLTQRSVEVLRVLVGMHNERATSGAIDPGLIATPDAMTRQLVSDDLGQFRIGVLRIVGDGGVLTRAPFSLSSSRFKVQ